MMTTKPTTCQTQHDFVLVLRGIADVTNEAADALFEAGCGDATASVRSGRVFLTFSRVSDSLKNAVISAIIDVRKANIGANVLRVDVCNLVTQADIARRIARSRQLVRQYITGERGPGGFPPPACNIADRAPLWYWCEVSWWLWENDMVPENVAREAQEVGVINSALDLYHERPMNPNLASAVVKSLQLTRESPPHVASDAL
jgi:hypothetical protein